MRSSAQPAHVTAAEAACAAAEALDSTAQEVHMAIGNLRLATGEPAEAETAFRHALEFAPQSSDVLIGLAMRWPPAASSTRPDAAYRRAIAAQPRYAGRTSPMAISCSGAAGRRMRSPVQARHDSRAGQPECIQQPGRRLSLSRRFRRGRRAFARSLALEPRRTSYSNLGTVQYYRGRYRKPPRCSARRWS